jgi:hypothetical protein
MSSSTSRDTSHFDDGFTHVAPRQTPLSDKVIVFYNPDSTQLVFAYVSGREAAIHEMMRSFGFGRSGYGPMPNLGFKVPVYVYGTKFHSLEGFLVGAQPSIDFSIDILRDRLQQGGIELVAEQVDLNLNEGVLGSLDYSIREELARRINIHLGETMPTEQEAPFSRRPY